MLTISCRPNTINAHIVILDLSKGSHQSFLPLSSAYYLNRNIDCHELTPQVQLPAAQPQLAQVQLGFPQPPIVFVFEVGCLVVEVEVFRIRVVCA